MGEGAHLRPLVAEGPIGHGGPQCAFPRGDSVLRWQAVQISVCQTLKGD